MTEKKRILVVDDDNAVRDTICENLRELDYEVMEAANGFHAMEIIKIHGFPNLVITDIIMPKMGGIEMIDEIRGVNQSVNIIAMSGGGRTESEDFLKVAMQKGANMVFQKPVDMSGLETAVSNLVA